MSIDAYTGLPGSGKTYSVIAQQIVPGMKAGRQLVTNIPVKTDLLKQDFPKGEISTFSTEQLQANPETIATLCPPGAILILDEVWRIFPAGWQVAKIPDAYKSFFAEHRHRVNAKGDSTQIVLVTQDLAQISAFARQLVETTYRTTKLTTVGLSKRYRVDVYHGPQSGPNANPSNALRQIFGKYEPKIYRYYTSHTQSEAAAEGANEKSVDGRANALKRPLLLMAPLIILGLVGYGLYGLYHNGLAGNKTPTVDGFKTLAPAGPHAEGSPARARSTEHARANPGYAIYAGLCMMGRCGWAYWHHQWMSLTHCKEIDLQWTCARGPVTRPAGYRAGGTGTHPAETASHTPLAASPAARRSRSPAALPAVGRRPARHPAVANVTYSDGPPIGPQTRD